MTHPMTHLMTHPTVSTTGRSNGNTRPSTHDDDEPPPLISLDESTSPPSLNDPHGVLPRSLVHMYVTGLYARCTLANFDHMCRNFNLWALVKGIFTHTLLLLSGSDPPSIDSIICTLPPFVVVPSNTT